MEEIKGYVFGRSAVAFVRGGVSRPAPTVIFLHVVGDGAAATTKRLGITYGGAVGILTQIEVKMDQGKSNSALPVNPRCYAQVLFHRTPYESLQWSLDAIRRFTISVAPRRNPSPPLTKM